MKWPSQEFINFNQFGESTLGYISVAEFQKNIKFEIKRVFWTYFTPESVTRGGHAHYNTEQVIIALAGTIRVVTISKNTGKNEYILQSPNIGLYIPPDSWHTMQYTHNAIQLVLASQFYDEADYIRDFDLFKKIYL